MATKPVHQELHRVCSTAIIWKRENDGELRYLITKRAPSKKAWPNKWTVPGGGLDVEDYIDSEATYANTESPQWYGSLEKGLRREISEEVGVEVHNPQYLLDITFVRPDGIPVLVLSFHCEYKSGEVKLDDDSVEYAWIAASEVGDYDLIQGIDHEIEMVDKALNKKHG